MTALAGYRDWRGDTDSAAQCRRMLKAQAVYGESDAQCVAGPIALGRRLFALLPEDRFDRGPVTGGDGRFTLVADVRLDNRDELAPGRSDLCDAAIVMLAFERWGDAAIPRLLGDFALALWDAAARRLLLARDFQGQRPLFYHHSDAFTAFASMPKGLHALAQIQYRPDEEAVCEFLALLAPDRGSSFFEGVARVAPGHVVTIDDCGVSSRSYWQPDLAPLRLSAGEAVEAVRGELERAVQCRLRGAGEAVGSHLSAGLDSAGVTATAARLSAQAKVVAFTAVPRDGFDAGAVFGRLADEGPLAGQVAALYPNVEHVRVATDRRSPVADLDRYFHLFERPVLNLVNSVWAMRINELAQARGIRVMLTGTMGNLSFSYTGLDRLPQLLREGRWVRLAREIRRYARLSGSSLGGAARLALAPWLPEAVLRAVGKLPRDPIRELAIMTGISAATVRERDLLTRTMARDADFVRATTADSVARRLRTLGAIDPGNYNKGVLGGWQIDIRDPTADRRLVELCLRIPLEHYFVDGTPRSLARTMLADRLPAALLAEPRKGYQAADWHEGVDGARAEISAEIERLAGFAPAAALIDIARMKALLADWPADWERDEVRAAYRLALLTSVSAGHFLRKASGANS